MDAAPPAPRTPPRFTDAFDPVVLTSPRAVGRLTVAAYSLAGPACAAGLLLGPVLGWLAGLPMATIGTACAAIDLAHALLARRADRPWAVGAVAVNLAAQGVAAWLISAVVATIDRIQTVDSPRLEWSTTMAEHPSASPPPRPDEESTDPITAAFARRPGGLSIAALVCAGAALTSLVFGPLLGVLLTFTGGICALGDLLVALGERRPNWPWAPVALLFNLVLGVVSVLSVAELLRTLR